MPFAHFLAHWSNVATIRIYSWIFQPDIIAGISRHYIHGHTFLVYWYECKFFSLHSSSFIILLFFWYLKHKNYDSQLPFKMLLHFSCYKLHCQYFIDRYIFKFLYSRNGHMTQPVIVSWYWYVIIYQEDYLLLSVWQYWYEYHLSYADFLYFLERFDAQHNSIMSAGPRLARFFIELVGFSKLFDTFDSD